MEITKTGLKKEIQSYFPKKRIPEFTKTGDAIKVQLPKKITDSMEWYRGMGKLEVWPLVEFNAFLIVNPKKAVPWKRFILNAAENIIPYDEKRRELVLSMLKKPIERLEYKWKNDFATAMKIKKKYSSERKKKIALGRMGYLEYYEEIHNKSPEAQVVYKADLKKNDGDFKGFLNPPMLKKNIKSMNLRDLRSHKEWIHHENNQHLLSMKVLKKSIKELKKHHIEVLKEIKKRTEEKGRKNKK